VSWCCHEPQAAPVFCCRHQTLIDLNVVSSHARGREPLIEASSHASPVERQQRTKFPNALFFAIYNEAGYTFINDFCNRAVAESKNWGTACHRLDHDQTERLGPVDRK